MNTITTFFSEIQQKLLKKRSHNYSNLEESQIVFYMHQQQPMQPDHATQFEENLSSYHGGIHED